MKQVKNESLYGNYMISLSSANYMNPTKENMNV